MSASSPPVLLLDGGLGTTLDDFYAVKFSHMTPMWSSHLLLSAPETLLAAQTAFASAGADILLTATYQASFNGFHLTPRLPSHTDGDHHVSDPYTKEEATSFMRSAISLARKALSSGSLASANDTARRIALSLGAYGATLIPSQEYSGKYDSAHQSIPQLAEWHAERLLAFSTDPATWKSISLIAFETLPMLNEIWAVRRAVDSVCEDRPSCPESKGFWIACVFPNSDEGMQNRLPDGSTVRQVVEAMLKPGQGLAAPMGIGINCTKIGRLRALLSLYETAVKDIVEAEGLEWPSLVIYPDGTTGEVYNTTTQTWELPPGITSQQNVGRVFLTSPLKCSSSLLAICDC